MRKQLHYIIPILGLILVNFIYFYPALQGKVITQDDIMQGKATSNEIKEYRAAEGEEPLWTQAIFSGMPAIQISTRYPNNWLTVPAKTLAYLGGNIAGIHIIFSLMFGFYLLLISMKTNPWLSAVGAIAFAFSAFFIISFGAGHNAKVRTAAFIAPVIMGALLTYRKKYLLGFALTALFVGLAVNSNHFQVNFYMGIILLIMASVEFVYALKEKTQANFWKASAILVFAAVLGVGPNISNLWSTYEYQKESIRGGSSELSSLEESKGGLTKEYAMNWSYGIGETFNLIMGDFSGGGSAQTYEQTEVFQQYQPRIVQNIASQGVPRKQAEQQANQYFGTMFYWGDQGMVNGGYYVGAVVFFLFVLGFFVVEGRIRWWIGIVTFLAIMMAWGKNFMGLNGFLFDHLPLYNKFRVPSYTFTIVFFTMPFLGFLAAGKILGGNYDKAKIKKQLLYTLYITGGLCLFFIALGSAFFDFDGPRDQQLAEQGIDLDLLVEDRISLLRSSAFKTLAFCALSFGLLWFYIQQKLKPAYVIGILAVLVISDQWTFDKEHLSADDFVTKKAFKNTFVMTPADQTILQDKDPHYRVFNTTAGLTSDARTSYYHKSLSGYHGAKLIRYQDLIDNQMSKSNFACFNMLNAKWFIVGDQQTGQKRAQKNPQACGNAWFVDEIKTVADADAEMAALSEFEPLKTAIIDKRYSESIPENLKGDGTSTIKLSKFGVKDMVYEANVTSPSQFAVFSEIYYEGGDKDWKTYIDGEETDHIRVNYLLRGMTIPQGKHTIEFKFAPRSYITGEKISLVFSILLALALIGTVAISFKNRKQNEAIDA